MAREPKLERLDIPAECRVVKDWFRTREEAEAALPAIHAHIKATGQTHTCFCHTHTKPPANAVPVYLDEFEIPERYRKAKRFSPCPCCWDEFPKFGCGRIAWFEEERVIRIMGEDCFAALNPEGHEHARTQYEIEQARRRTRQFLLSNVGRVPEVVTIIERAIVVADAAERMHGLLHNRLGMVRHNLWPYVRRNGQLFINVREEEFRRGAGGEMYTHEIDGTRVFAILDGYEMLDPATPRLSEPLQRALGRIRPYRFGDDWEARIEQMTDQEKLTASEELSRGVRAAREKIAEIEKLKRFAERVTINTLRAWGAHEGCPVPFNYEHSGRHIRLGRSDAQMVGFPLPDELQDRIGEIDFWVEPERRRRR